MHSEEFNKLVLGHKGRLFRLAKWMLHNNEDAEDVVQETFVKLWKMKDKLAAYQSIEALSVEITKNMCLNKIKSQRLTVSEEKIEKIQTTEAVPDIRMDLVEKLNRVRKAIAKLPPQQQIVMQLKGVEGMETREIASMMNETDNNVRVMLSRARKVVRASYNKYYGDEG